MPAPPRPKMEAEERERCERRVRDERLSIVDVIVVGAGVAGLTAAEALGRAGLTVVVLEGATRPGGRLKSEQMPCGQTVELGANWVHGLDSCNPVAALATSLGCLHGTRLTCCPRSSVGAWPSLCACTLHPESNCMIAPKEA